MTVSKGVDPDLQTMLDDVMSRAGAALPPTAETTLDRDLWQTLEKVGVTTLISEQGGTWVDAAATLHTAAYHAAAVPLAEHDLLAGWLRTTAGLPASSEVSTVAYADELGVAYDVPWVGDVDRVIVIWSNPESPRVRDLPASELEIQTDHDAINRPTGTVQVDADPRAGVPIGADTIRSYWVRGALARASQVSGALSSAVSLAATYAKQRHQFGRPVAQFQAVQHLVVDALAESVLANTAVDTAAVRADDEGIDSATAVDAIAVAKSVTARATSVVARSTHQVLGAMGTTFEHPLHRRTEPALRWRSEFGSALEWERHIIDQLTAESTDSLWSWIAR